MASDPAHPEQSRRFIVLRAARPVLLAVALSAFLARGVWAGCQARAARGTAFLFGPLGALEMHAQYGAGKPGALAALQTALAAAPPDKPILIFHGEKNTHGWMAADVIRYLSWPRAVERTAEPLGAGGRTFAQLSAQYSALVLCETHTPANMPGVHRVGPRLEVVVPAR
jgi:hypothetical protein